VPGGLIRPCVGWRAVERQNRQTGELRHAGRNLDPKHAAQRGAILRREPRKDAREIGGREPPFRHEGGGARPAQQAAHFCCAKARVDVHGKRAKPSAGKDRGQVSGPVREPQRNTRAGTNARFAQSCRHAQHAFVESAPVQRARSVGHGRSRGVQSGPRH